MKTTSFSPTIQLTTFLALVLLFLFFFSCIAQENPTALKSNKITLPLNLNLPDDPFWKEDAIEANNNINHFEEGSNDTNYADYRYVGAHNDHVYHRFFEVVRQQDQTLLGRLTYGIRGLMWDTYDFNLSWPAAIRGPEGAKVCLSHPAPGFLAFTQKGHNSYQSLQYELRRLIEFMKVTPNAVITLVLENYASTAQTNAEIAAVLKAANYDPIFKPMDWPQADQANQEWPTLGWMRANNKRLVIFTQFGLNSVYTWREFTHCIENQYSTTDENILCNQREESQKLDQLQRKLVIFNNFNGLAVTQATSSTKNQVSYDTSKRVTTNCQAKNFAHKRLFNGYFADRIVDSCNDLYEHGQKTVFEYVNELNKKADKTAP